MLRLGERNVFVHVKPFQGKVLIHLRKYEGEGDLYPTKKGIALSPGEWNALKDKVSTINIEIEKKKLDPKHEPNVKVNLGRGGVKLAYNQFNGFQLVNVRLYFEENGELYPTQKGIAMNLKEWQTLQDLIPEIDAEIQSRTPCTMYSPSIHVK